MDDDIGGIEFSCDSTWRRNLVSGWTLEGNSHTGLRPGRPGAMPFTQNVQLRGRPVAKVGPVRAFLT